MSGPEMFVGALVAIGAALTWRRLLYKEEQYTLMGWLCLGACISLTYSVGELLVNT